MLLGRSWNVRLWEWLHRDRSRVAAVEELRAAVGGIGDIGLLRCIDVALWMRGKRGPERLSGMHTDLLACVLQRGKVGVELLLDGRHDSTPGVGNRVRFRFLCGDPGICDAACLAS